jgi:hypothetical protein
MLQKLLFRYLISIQIFEPVLIPAVQTITAKDAKTQQEYGRVVELLKIALSWQPGHSELKTQLMTNGRYKPDFSDLNTVALKRLKTTTSLEEQLKIQTADAKKYKKGFESLQFQHELLQAQLKNEISYTTRLKEDLKRNPTAEKIHELEQEVNIPCHRISQFSNLKPDRLPD